MRTQAASRSWMRATPPPPRTVHPVTSRREHGCDANGPGALRAWRRHSAPSGCGVCAAARAGWQGQFRQRTRACRHTHAHACTARRHTHPHEVRQHAAHHQPACGARHSSTSISAHAMQCHSSQSAKAPRATPAHGVERCVRGLIQVQAAQEHAAPPPPPVKYQLLLCRHHDSACFSSLHLSSSRPRGNAWRSAPCSSARSTPGAPPPAPSPGRLGAAPMPRPGPSP